MDLEINSAFSKNKSLHFKVLSLFLTVNAVWVKEGKPPPQDLEGEKPNGLDRTSELFLNIDR